MKKLEEIDKLICEGEVDQAIQALNEMKNSSTHTKESIFYLLGNAYRKKGDLQKALNYYQYAIEESPESPAVSAREQLVSILNFYDKNMFNQ